MINQDHRDILSAFIDADVEFLVVGAYALAVHGVVRATGDIDLWVGPSPENAKRVYDALIAFGAPSEQFTTSDFVQPDLVLQIGVVPHRIDVITSIDGVEFADAWEHRTHTEIDGLAVPFLGRDHLIKNKRASGRTQDLADLESLEGSPE